MMKAEFEPFAFSAYQRLDVTFRIDEERTWTTHSGQLPISLNPRIAGPNVVRRYRELVACAQADALVGQGHRPPHIRLFAYAKSQ